MITKQIENLEKNLCNKFRNFDIEIVENTEMYEHRDATVLEITWKGEDTLRVFIEKDDRRWSLITHTKGGYCRRTNTITGLTIPELRTRIIDLFKNS